MLARRPAAVVAGVLLAAGLVWGLFQLFQLRFAAGDVYPQYSSLRGDPLGSKVLYEAIGLLENREARRNFRPPPHFPGGRDTTLFVFGLPWTEMWADPSELRSIEEFLHDGGRLVITMYPQLGAVRSMGLTNTPVFRRSSPFGEPPVDLTAKWGCGMTYVPVPRAELMQYESVSARTMMASTLPETVSWHSALVFTNLGIEWRVVYARGTDPVMIERPFGKGSLVLATDSYFVSNEAMQKEREPALLAWLTGASKNIIFDEVHLGVQEQPGVATLARRYRLHGGAIALAVVALLFVWHSSASFLPRREEQDQGEMVRGRESASGFVNLVRRSVSPATLMQTCLNEWHKCRQLDSRATPRKLDRIRAAVEARNAGQAPDNTATYNEISRILNEK